MTYLQLNTCWKQNGADVSRERRGESLSLSLCLSQRVHRNTLGGEERRGEDRRGERAAKPLDGVNNKGPGEKNRWTFREREREEKEREGRLSDVMPRLCRGHAHTQCSLEWHDSEVWWEFQKIKMTSRFTVSIRFFRDSTLNTQKQTNEKCLFGFCLCELKPKMILF